MGTMNIGGQVDEPTADRMLAVFLDRGHREIDTAYTYADGASEEILGRLLTPERRRRVYLATKANPCGGGGLGRERLIVQVETSLRRLKTDCLDLLYLHAPDAKTPIEETLAACAQLFQEGKIRELGLSNYASWQTADIWHRCKKNGWIAPTVYQGRYNAVTRDVEGELFPALRHFGIRFYAYNPLAGGLLSGKYGQIHALPKEGRFALKSAYRDRFWKEGYFQALEIIESAVAAAGLPMLPTALRWLMHHSLLRGAGGDGVILAASNPRQWEENLSSLSGPLPAEVREAIDRAWKKALPDCPPYFRS